MRFKPCGNRVLAEKIEITETESGIQLPVGINIKQATIVEVGPDVENTTIQIGMRVMYGAHSSIMLNNKEFLIIYEKDIIGMFLND